MTISVLWYLLPPLQWMIQLTYSPEIQSCSHYCPTPIGPPTCLSPRLSYPILPVLLLPDSNQQAMPLAVVYKYPDILTSNHFSLYPHLKSKYMKMVKASEVIMDRALISYPNIILKVLWEFIIFFQNSNSLNSV